ncbi:MAG: nucleotidyltransferase domain-containing protein [Thermoleophilia bacterium]
MPGFSPVVDIGFPFYTLAAFGQIERNIVTRRNNGDRSHADSTDEPLRLTELVQKHPCKTVHKKYTIVHNMYTIDQLFTSKARVELLKLFLMNSERDYYLREAAGLAGLPVHAVQREVEKLEKAGLLEKNARGNRIYLRANRNSPIFNEMRSIVMKTVGLGDSLSQALASGADKIKVAFIFGSVARGEDSGLSDIDLLVVGSISGRELSTLISSFRQSIGREINQLTMTSSELKKRIKDKDNFLMTVLKQPKLFLVGDESVLKALAE